jgi:hypothetical protein
MRIFRLIRMTGRETLNAEPRTLNLTVASTDFTIGPPGANITRCDDSLCAVCADNIRTNSLEAVLSARAVSFWLAHYLLNLVVPGRI